MSSCSLPPHPSLEEFRSRANDLLKAHWFRQPSQRSQVTQVASPMLRGCCAFRRTDLRSPSAASIMCRLQSEGPPVDRTSKHTPNGEHPHAGNDRVSCSDQPENSSASEVHFLGVMMSQVTKCLT